VHEAENGHFWTFVVLRLTRGDQQLAEAAYRIHPPFLKIKEWCKREVNRDQLFSAESGTNTLPSKPILSPAYVILAG